MTKTKALAWLVAIAGTLMYLKTTFFYPGREWDVHNRAGVEAYNKGDDAKAEAEFLMALKEAEQFPPVDRRLIQTLNNLAELYRRQGQFAKATPLRQRSLELAEKLFGPDSPTVAAYLNNLAENYRARGFYAKAEPLYKRALVIWRNFLDPDNPLLEQVRQKHEEVLRQLGRDKEAEPNSSASQPTASSNPSSTPP